MIKNKKILILGMARSGIAAARLLSKFDNKIILTDSKEQNKEEIEELSGLGINCIITNNQLDLLDESIDVLVKNPGIGANNEVVLKAKKLGINIINEIEASYSLIPKSVKIIGITGSNGKTTTTTLIYEILKKKYNNVHLAGNIGFPLSQVVENIKDNDILVMEISDHQLCDMYEFKTNISLLLNIVPAHLDFHGSYEIYKSMKKRIFNNHTNNDLVILNFDDKEVINLAKDIKSNKKYFSFNEEAESYIKNNCIYYQNQEIMNIDDIRIKGKHNYENILAAVTVVKQFDVENEIISEYLKEFKGVEHRIEFVREINKRLFYNDSKATNNEATITALKSFSKPIILIMGGLDRNMPFDDLTNYLTNVKSIISYGETKDKLEEFALKNKINNIKTNTLDEATIIAYQESEENDIILLSPACASWDQFDNFEIRGNLFKKVVNEIKEK